jgi:hypothetical protein
VAWGRLIRLVVACAFAASVASCGNPSAGLPPPTPSPTAGCTASPSPTSPSQSPSPSPAASPSGSPAAAQRSIEISLSKQHLWAFQGSASIVSTDVTTGMPALPTPIGRFRVMAKYSPYRFISPWPKGSPYYYDPLNVSFAMLFAQGGYFIHDAAWQRNFGPGGNLKSGSHGCVNVPPAAMPALYRWARVGDPVVIVR